MRISRFVLLAFLSASGLVSSAYGVVTAADLAESDVVFDSGVNRTEADRQRLQAASSALGGQGFRTKFVVIPNSVGDIHGLAKRLRGQFGEAALESVIVLGPRQIGVGAKVLPCEAVVAVQEERATLRSDDIQGTINVANRLLEFSKANELRDSDCQPIPDPKHGLSTALIVALFGAAVALVAALFLARRSIKRNARERADEERAAISPVLDVLSAQITDLGDEVGMGPNAAESKRRYETALSAYGEVRDELEKMDGWDAARMRDRLREGIHEALAARALVDGKPAPPEGQPILEGLCAFDPKHGRAVTNHEIVTPSGNHAIVPVCATCEAGLQHKEMPQTRMVVVNGREVPYWQIQGMGGMFGPPMGQMLGGLLEEMLGIADQLSGGTRRRR
jgi:hypothetical protein